MLDSIIHQLSALPLGWLYLIAALVAAFENIFPPFPSDVVVAFSVFVSARLGGPFWLAALAVTIGNVAGGMLMYFVGRRYGSLILLEKLERYVGKSAAPKLQAMHAEYGVGALFVSRFLPGLRALVPPFAGAMRIPAWHVFIALTIASGIWYIFVAYLAYQAGENWSLVVSELSKSATLFGVGAVVIAAICGLVWYIRKKRRTSRDAS